MASYNDLTITSTAWVDIYAAVGLATTAQMYLQSKSQGSLLYFEAASAPAVSSTSGLVISGNMLTSMSILPAAGMKVYLKGRDASVVVAMMSAA